MYLIFKLFNFLFINVFCYVFCFNFLVRIQTERTPAEIDIFTNSKALDMLVSNIITTCMGENTDNKLFTDTVKVSNMLYILHLYLFYIFLLKYSFLQH